MDYDFYNWCANLFAYLYKHYEEIKLVDELPARMQYEIPETFHKRIGECQVHVNTILRKRLRSVFKRNYSIVCRSKVTFETYVERACLRVSPTFEKPVLFLGLCAIVSELNLYCFQQGCYRYALYAPECLEKVLKRNDSIAAYISDRKDGTSDEFEKLVEYCDHMLKFSHVSYANKREEFDNFGTAFRKYELTRYMRKHRQFKRPMGAVPEENGSSEEEKCDDSETACKGSSEEGKGDSEAARKGSSEEGKSDSETARKGSSECESEESSSAFAREEQGADLFAAPEPFNKDACVVCQEENCKRYLEEFVKQFSSGNMRYAPASIP